MYASYAVTSSPFGVSEDCARRRSACCGPYHLFALTMCFPRALSATSHLASTLAQPLGIFLGPTITLAMAFTYPHSQLRNFSHTHFNHTLAPWPNPPPILKLHQAVRKPSEQHSFLSGVSPPFSECPYRWGIWWSHVPCRDFSLIYAARNGQSVGQTQGAVW